jgi:hypothetical protein
MQTKDWLLTLLIDLAALAVGGVRVVGRIGHLPVALVDHATSTGSAVLARHLAVGRLVPNRGELRTNASSVSRRLSSLCRITASRRVNLVGLSRLSSGSTLTLFGSFTLRFFLLLPSLPLLANFLEFYTKQLVSDS